MYVSTPFNPEPLIDSPRGVLPITIKKPLRLITCHLIGHRMVESPQCPSDVGVTIHFYEPNMRTDWKISLKKFPEFREFPPSHPIIQEIRAHFFLAFLMLFITTDQLLYVDVIMRLRYFIAVILLIGWPYAWNDASMPTWASSASNLW